MRFRRTIHVVFGVIITLGTASTPAFVGAASAAGKQVVARSVGDLAAAKPPKIKGDACTSEDGVTVVVDFRNLRNGTDKKMNLIRIGCAEGDQDSGFAALLGAGFDVDPDSPFVCKIDNRPLDRPTCPAPDGFWAYSHGERGGDWTVSGVGAGDWDPPAGSLEGWSWCPYEKDWGLPRVTPDDLFPPGE